MLTLALFVTSIAAAGGHYHPVEVAAASSQYQRASAGAGAQMAALQERAAMLSTALADYEEALDLMGEHAPKGDRERLAQQTVSYNRQFAVAQAFADELVADFDAEFTAAMTRATPAGAVECQPMVPDGRGVPGMRQPMKKNPDCTGDDLNGAIAQAMDADPTLKAAIDEILTLSWPALEPQADVTATRVGEGEPYIDVGEFFRSVWPDRLDRIRREDSKQRLDFEAAIEEGATAQDLAQMTSKAQQITAATAQRRAALGQPVFAAADKSFAKWAKSGREIPSWCAQPQALGGCDGTDASDELGRQLLTDKRIGKALR